MTKKIAVFQHLAVEHPGVFRDFLRDDAIEWHTFELDEGEAIPELGDFSALWVLGGPMDVWQEQEHPWLVAEKAAIKHAVSDLELQFLGICLGHQLFAESLGGKVAPGQQAEVGLGRVELTTSGQAHDIFSDFDAEISCLQWHSAEVSKVPAELEVLASSSHCRVQALARRAHQVSIQFHIEVTAHTVGEWGAIPAYKKSLEDSLGEDGLAVFAAQTEKNLARFNRDAKTFYTNWKKLAGF